LGIAVTSQHLIQKEIKRRLKSGIACFHSVHNFLSYPTSKNIIYKTKILPILTLREEHRLRVFQNRVLRGISRRKREKSGTLEEAAKLEAP
jgi:hypothetical protein